MHVNWTAPSNDIQQPNTSERQELLSEEEIRRRPWSGKKEGVMQPET